jgi:hypothetical protein
LPIISSCGLEVHFGLRWQSEAATPLSHDAAEPSTVVPIPKAPSPLRSAGAGHNDSGVPRHGLVLNPGEIPLIHQFSPETEMRPALAPHDVLAYLHVMLVIALKIVLATGFGFAILALL